MLIYALNKGFYELFSPAKIQWKNFIVLNLIPELIFGGALQDNVVGNVLKKYMGKALARQEKSARYLSRSVDVNSSFTSLRSVV